MKTGPFVVFEGLPGAGKTTVSRYLSLHDAFHRIGEVLDENQEEIYGEHTNDRPNRFFLQSDLRKYSQAHIWFELNGQVPIMDRGFLSTLAFSYAKYGAHSPQYQSVRQWFFNRQDLFVEPEIYVYFDVDPTLCNFRKARMPDQTGTWLNIDSLSVTRDYYEKHFRSSQVQVIQINANEPLVCVIEQSLAMASTVKELFGSCRE